MNYQDLLTRLRDTEETTLVELLGITSDDIVDAFLDRIIETEEYLQNHLEENKLDGYEEE